MASVELAVLLPVLCFLFVLAIDYARIFYYSVTLNSAARNGAYYASNYPGIYAFQSAQQVVASDVSNMTPAPTTTIRYSFFSNGPYIFSTPISSGFVQVRVSWQFKTITRFPGVPATQTITRQCRMRVAPITPTF